MSDCNTSAFEPKQPRVLCTGCLETAKAKDIEQRYEQLAQVAREMLGWMKNPENFYAGLTNEEDWRQFEESLAELGVSVDD